jgi:hypothetical protein
MTVSPLHTYVSPLQDSGKYMYRQVSHLRNSACCPRFVWVAHKQRLVSSVMFTQWSSQQTQTALSVGDKLQLEIQRRLVWIFGRTDSSFYLTSWSRPPPPLYARSIEKIQLLDRILSQMSPLHSCKMHVTCPAHPNCNAVVTLGSPSSRKGNTVFWKTSVSVLRPTQPPAKWVPAFFPRLKSGLGVKMTLLLPKLRMSGAGRSLPNMPSRSVQGQLYLLLPSSAFTD